ncbi:putative peptidyl prolyl cis-trans isomerase [Handroanthus impetiginosus]|uniref:Peptidyl-prolyl cis-trans isomerase n=1 Tax=Handroanthus impetiginosus TaxID=429701 RepID=A0A2G9H4J6_9LAMI|nr:putative peptidyl prolyl cis-trans isomerase [Handroanthus impetiginosus]
MSVMIVTSLGDIVVDLFADRCPLTCKNFLKLCKIKYYNGCLFHTVQKDFTAQTGDPTGTGAGGDSVYKFLFGNQARFFDDEIHLDLKHTKIGTVAMASAGENLNASQFYITLRDDLDYLDGKHTVFGEVAEGLDTLTRINEAYVDEKNRPYKNIRIKHTYILSDPFDDPSQLAELIPDASPEGKPKDEVDDEVRLEDDWVPLDEQLNPQELEEVLREKDAHSRAVVLETIGDIPEAEIKPPDNVLFVCKLNPVTEDEDLHTIFSRFGVVTSAEIIRDHKTGDSLCYAFIEFEDVEACEQAYFKMDNALIDDRRIHVDFSQSVAKLWSQYRHKGPKGQGGGCFKCGSLGHIAKDCLGDSTSEEPHSKYTLKDDNAQHGGDGSTRYEMVFEEEEDERARHSKRRRDHEAEQHDEKQNSKRRDAYNPKDRDDRGRDGRGWERRHERSKERREDEGYGRRQRSPYVGGAKDYSEKDGSSNGRKMDITVQRNSLDEREHRRRHDNDVGHKLRRDDKEYEKNRVDDAGHGYERDKRKYEKRVTDDGHRDRKNENETKKKSSNEDIRGGHRDRRDSGDDNYGDKRRGEERYSDKRSSRGDERYSDKRSSRGDELHDRTRRH